MSAVQNPQEKKRLSYDRDHYNRNGENNKSWRKTKPLKKRKANRAFRKSSNDLTKVVAGAEGLVNAERRLGSLRKEKVFDWGSVRLRDFVVARQRTRESQRRLQLSSRVRQKPKSVAGTLRWIRPKDVDWSFIGATSGPKGPGESRATLLTESRLTLSHKLTGVEVSGEVPEGHYTRREMREQKEALWMRLWLALDLAVARKLRAPGR